MEKQLYNYDKDKAVIDILDKYKKQWYAIVNFLYFFNFLKILEQKDTDYEKALKKSDFILPDGIALRLYFKQKYSFNLANLNGTDFIPFFLNWLRKQNIPFQAFLYWAKQNIIENVAQKFGSQRNIAYFQTGYSSLNWEQIIPAQNKVNILLVGIWSPKQEKFLAENIPQLKEKNLLAFGVGWLFDFLGEEEKRAPQIIRKANLEWLWRALSKPSKNLHKTLASFKLFYYLLKK